MTWNWKLTILVILALVIIGGFIYYQFFTPDFWPNLSTEQSVLPTGTVAGYLKAPAAAAPTGNIDDLTAALLDDAANETTAWTEETDDASLLGSDNRAINDFGQSYVENEL